MQKIYLKYNRNTFLKIFFEVFKDEKIDLKKKKTKIAKTCFFEYFWKKKNIQNFIKIYLYDCIIY